MSALLEVTNLTVEYPTRFGIFTAIDDVSMTVKAGEIHGLVGESGAGKSTIGAAIIGLLSSPGYIAKGGVKLHGDSLGKLSDAEYHKLRGAKISMIFQDPQTSLNPLLTIEDQWWKPYVSTRKLVTAKHSPKRWHCCRKLAWKMLKREFRNIRTSSREACASGLLSRWHCVPIRT